MLEKTKANGSTKADIINDLMEKTINGCILVGFKTKFISLIGKSPCLSIIALNVSYAGMNNSFFPTFPNIRWQLYSQPNLDSERILR